MVLIGSFQTEQDDHIRLPLPRFKLLFTRLRLRSCLSTRMKSRYFLCVSFFLALLQSTGVSGDLRKKHPNTVPQHESTSDRPVNANEDKPIGIFSRKRSLSPQKQQVPKPRPETWGGKPGFGRHCAHLMETCSVHSPCCSPCAICHCRLFNTICQCWRIGTCSRKN